MGGRIPSSLRFAERVGKRVWCYARKSPMTVVDKNRNRLAEPGCGENQVRDLIAIHVTSGDLQAAGRGDD